MEAENGQAKPKSVFSVDRKVVTDYSALKKIVEGHRAAKKTIAMTMGVFDMIHDGHAKYIELAKIQSQCDILILGVDSDELTRKNKGEGRPYDNLESRLTVLAAFGAVDHIMIRGVDEIDTKIAEVVKPDYLVISLSSAQYQPTSQAFVEDMTRRWKDTGLVSEIIALEPQSSNSTSAKLRELMVRGMKDLFNHLQKCWEEYLEKLTKP